MMQTPRIRLPQSSVGGGELYLLAGKLCGGLCASVCVIAML